MSKQDKTKVEDLNINDAISLKEKLDKMVADGDNIILSNEQGKQAADLIGTMLTLHAIWTKSKKKINRLLKSIFGNRSEKLKDLPNNNTNNGSRHSDHNNDENRNEYRDKDKDKGNENSSASTKDDTKKTRKVEVERTPLMIMNRQQR